MPVNHGPMRRLLIVATAAALAGVVAAATPAAADGVRRAWHGPAYWRAGITRDVITPYYVGYYPGHYSYYPPDPVYVSYVPCAVRYGCWRYGYWSC